MNTVHLYTPFMFHDDFASMLKSSTYTDGYEERGVFRGFLVSDQFFWNVRFILCIIISITTIGYRYMSQIIWFSIFVAAVVVAVAVTFADLSTENISCLCLSLPV